MRAHEFLIERIDVEKTVANWGDQAEKWIRDNKESFKRQYGKTWAKVLYATAWKKFGYKSRPKAKRRDQD